MKAKTKKFFAVCALALTLAVAIGYGVNKSMNPQLQLSDLAMANIQALSNPEVGPINPTPQPCPNKWTIRYLDCVDWQGRPTGIRQRICIGTGFAATCTPRPC